MNTRSMKPFVLLALAGASVAAAPAVLDAGLQRLCAEVLVAICLAQMWNLLAGYCGLLSLGHQLFVGIGAYVLFDLARRTGLSPYLLLPLCAVAGGLLAALLSLLLFRLRDGYFSIGIWVCAEVVALLVSKSAALGSSAGLTLDLSGAGDLEGFGRSMFWIAGALGVGSVAGLLALMRSRLGLAMMAVRDNELAARSLGVDVRAVRLAVFCLSGAVCGLAGATYFAGGLFVSPDAGFDINWVVMMMFATLIGGIGTIEGPLIGVLVWYGLREGLSTWLGLAGGWYLISMGAVAVAVSVLAPAGLWGLVRARTGWTGWSVQRMPPAAGSEAAP